MLSPLKLSAAVKVAQPGSFIKYYEGRALAIDTSRGKRAIREASYTLYEEGLVLLVCKKIGEEIYIYYAVRTKAAYTEKPSVLHRFERLERLTL